MPTISTLTVEVDAKTSKFTAGTKTALVGLAALGAGAAYAFGQFEESQKVVAQTDAVLKSTGNAAGVTADQVASLSSALSEKSGIDDEVIQSGENMLLTFKNIQNTAGEGNDIFNQASAATLDMAAGMAAASGGAVDMKSASIQLGKALNDPVAGISALTRVGVTFTEQQKKQIEQMVKSGDTVGAQQVILAELNSEFKGSAAAGKTSSAAMSVAMGNLAEAVGGVLAPAINAVLGIAITFFGFLSKYPAVLVAVAGAVGLLVAAWTAQKVISGITMIADVAHTAVIIAQTAALIASSAAIGIVTAAQWLWNAALTANPIGLIIVAIAAVIAIIVVLVKHFHLADNIMNVLKKTVDVVWGFIKAYVGLVIKLVVGYVKLWITAIGLVVKVITALAGIVGRAFMAVFNFVKQWLGKVVQINLQIWGSIIRFFGSIGGKLAKAGAGMWDWLWTGLKSVINMVINGLNWLINGINSMLEFHVDVPGPLPDVSFNAPDIPTIPSLRSGGQVMKTGWAMVHEGERFSGVGKDFGGTVNVYVQGSVISEHDLAETVQKVLLRSKRRSGALGLA